MDYEHFARLQARFTDEKLLTKEGYYRLRLSGKAQFELAFIKTGPCGESVYQPLIKGTFAEKEAIPTYLLDLAAQPMMQISQRTSENAALLDKVFVELMEKCEQAVEVNESAR
ncbi:hypothetical protein [Enterococcus innesii]|uniref:hypothetical protein n=1 Tax=Enterococcus innesii TaxID=2839759 RepID=UPI0020913458|nr:hypothetical protein [Enterococcus innesii]MCO5495715.1 hypothetical protein [Enterococcus innesii]